MNRGLADRVTSHTHFVAFRDEKMSLHPASGLQTSLIVRLTGEPVVRRLSMNGFRSLRLIVVANAVRALASCRFRNTPAEYRTRMAESHKNYSADGDDRRVRIASILGSLLLMLAVIACGAPNANAQDAARARGNLLAADNNEGVLMLNSGRIVSGKIKHVSTGFLVSSRSGHIAIARGDVRYAANDLSELYLLQKRELKDPSVAEQMKLAEWCVTQKLNAYAAKELIAVLGRDPQNESARRLLARLDDEQQRGSPTPQTRDSSGKKIADDEARSLAGLKGATAEKFASSVQPLLHNKCGNARCHGGSSEHEFRLSRGTPGAGNHRIYSERNLAAVLKHIDLDRPYESRMLKIADGAHAGQTIFSGHSGADQRKLLTEWVMQAARDLNPKATTQPPQSVFAGGFNPDRPQPQEHSTEPPSSIVRASATEKPRAPKSVTDPEALLTDSEKTNFRKVLESAESDAFDPEEFNRKFAQ